MKLLTECPYCGSKLNFDGIHLVCQNEDCRGRKKVSFYECIKLLEIKGLGEVMAYDLFDAGLDSPFDIFVKFNKDLNIVWDKNIEKVYKKVREIKSIKLETVIQMCGFDGMGATTSKQCAKEYAGQSFDYFGLDRMVVEGFGCGGHKRNVVDEVVGLLQENGIEVIYPVEEPKNIIGIEFTGSPKPNWDTKDKYLAAINSISVQQYKNTKLTDAKYLITDSLSSSSSKMTIAKKKGIAIMTYEDFYKALV